MVKWKCEVCGNEFENFHAQGFDNKIYCPLCYFKKENQELKLELSGYRQAILNNKEMLGLKEKNDKLKKQLEEKNKPQIFIDTQNIEERYAEGLYQDYLEEENKKHKTQQKKFIKYMNDIIEDLEKRYKDVTSVIGSYGSNTDLLYGKKYMLEEILQKYKEIIGDDK